MKNKRSHQIDRLAKLYDAEILPVWSSRFGRLLLRQLDVPPKSMLLEVGTQTGHVALSALKKLDEQSRLIAVDPIGPLLDVAREKAASQSGRRVFFRTESAEPRLSFADDVFDRVLGNLALPRFARPERACRDFARVCKPGGQVLSTLWLSGTFAEFTDVLREVLLRLDRREALDRLDLHLAAMPTAERARGWFEGAGLRDVTVERERFTLLFRSSREFFYAPVIEYGPLAAWKEIAGKGDDMQEVFRACKEAIDTYFGGGSFALSVEAACITGRKPTPEEDVTLPPSAVPSVSMLADSDGALTLGTGEIEFLDAALGLGQRDRTNVLGAGEVEEIDDPDLDDGDSDEDEDILTGRLLPRGLRGHS